MKLVTRKLFNGECMKKRITLIVFSVLIIVALYVLYCFNYIPHKKYTNADFNIEAYKSNIDKDNDGIDDQTDILNNANNYIKTNPKYKSKYYNTGYPDDEYGVCTDVVAFALKDAGYDLMVLVNEDIKNNKELYDIDAVDKNIDFRRVKNLKVYFDNNAISLTTDINEIEEWQGGDIVVFKKHIGIISDKRNRKGICFVIHHANPYQIYYGIIIFALGMFIFLKPGLIWKLTEEWKSYRADEPSEFYLKTTKIGGILFALFGIIMIMLPVILE